MKNTNQIQFVKGSFEYQNEYILIVIGYYTEQDLTNALQKLQSLGFQYDGVFSPLQTITTPCDYANQYFLYSNKKLKHTSYHQLSTFL